MLTLIASAAGDPTVQQVLIEKGALDLTVALLSERHQRTKEQHERVTLAGVYVLDRFVAFGFAAGRVHRRLEVCEPCVAGAQDQTVDRAAVRRLPVQLTSLQKCHFAVDSAASMRPSL